MVYHGFHGIPGPMGQYVPVPTTGMVSVCMGMVWENCTCSIYVHNKYTGGSHSVTQPETIVHDAWVSGVQDIAQPPYKCQVTWQYAQGQTWVKVKQLHHIAIVDKISLWHWFSQNGGPAIWTKYKIWCTAPVIGCKASFQTTVRDSVRNKFNIVSIES